MQKGLALVLMSSVLLAQANGDDSDGQNIIKSSDLGDYLRRACAAGELSTLEPLLESQGQDSGKKYLYWFGGHYSGFVGLFLKFGHVDAARALLERGFSSNAVSADPEEHSPLQDAVTAGCVEGAQLLLERGALVSEALVAEAEKYGQSRYEGPLKTNVMSIVALLKAAPKVAPPTPASEDAPEASE